MAAVPLPGNPSLAQLRKQAKDVRDLARAGVRGALDLVAAHHPDGAHPVSLTGAQLVVARHYGFASWARLKHHLELVERYRREPDQVGDPADLPGLFVTLACLRCGGDDSPGRWQRAAALLAAHPEITRGSIHAAAAATDAAAAAALLAADPALARTDGGPYRWEPILYLCYARHDPAVSEAAALDTARLLLEHGADPDAGYLWHGMTTPFTALTGALGSGGDGQPPHPHAMALAALLLSAGADANDGQALYNRQFAPTTATWCCCCRMGLAAVTAGPWRARLGHTTDSPRQMVRTQLWWAVVHDMADRVRQLIDHGADYLTPYEAPGGQPYWARSSDGRTPAEVAALAGCPAVLDLLVARGAAPPATDGADGLVAAALAGDRTTAERLRLHAGQARAQRPALIVWAAARGARDAIALLADMGFDVNALGRADAPIEQAWQTALHQAASAGDLQMARMLLDLGADPSIRDARFGSTPLGWSRYVGHQELTDLLEPVTTPDPATEDGA
ncbi:MAG: ankyrin repeat domain-containing protein [Streptosporangiaceae bacterium]